MTRALYRAVYEYVTACGQRPEKHRVSVSRILKLLGVSRSGYYAWKKRGPSGSEKRREQIKDRIKDIYEESHHNYGAPKITEKLKKEGRHISEKTVGNYMRQMGIRVSDGELRETQTANYFSNIYPIDCAVLSVNA